MNTSNSSWQAGNIPPDELDHQQILCSLDRICNSASFQGSGRCQQFLRFVVQEALSGRAKDLKERTIAMDVFGRGLDFSPGETALVRVRARQLRKRLANYYESQNDEPYRIEVPLGGYAPRFIEVAAPLRKVSERIDPAVGHTHTAEFAAEIQTPPIQPSSWSRRKFLLSSAAAIGAVVAGTASLEKLHVPASALDELWQPVFRTGKPLVIFIPVLKDRFTNQLSDRVGIGPLKTLNKTSEFLATHNYPYQLRLGSDLNFSLLREQPSLLMGGFSSDWTLSMTRGLRFALHWDADCRERALTDTVTGNSWKSFNPTKEGYADIDYGLVTRIFNRETGQIAMIAGGLTTFGTEGAASLLTHAASFRQIIDHAPKEWQGENFQAVVRIGVVGTTISTPQIVSAYFWEANSGNSGSMQPGSNL